MTISMPTTSLDEATAAGLQLFAATLTERLSAIEGVEVQDMGHRQPFFWAIYRSAIGAEIDSQEARACRLELEELNEHLAEHLPARVQDESPLARVEPQAPFLFSLSHPCTGGMIRGEVNVSFGGHKEGVVGSKELRCNVVARMDINSLFLHSSNPASFDVEALAATAEALFGQLRAACVAVTKDAIKMQVESARSKNKFNT